MASARTVLLLSPVLVGLNLLEMATDKSPLAEAVWILVVNILLPLLCYLGLGLVTILWQKYKLYCCDVCSKDDQTIQETWVHRETLFEMKRSFLSN